MNETEFFQEFHTLSPFLKKEVEDFTQFLKTKYAAVLPQKKERKFGYAKGFFTMMPDFDEPLEDLKDYM